MTTPAKKKEHAQKRDLNLPQTPLMVVFNPLWTLQEWFYSPNSNSFIVLFFAWVGLLAYLFISIFHIPPPRAANLGVLRHEIAILFIIVPSHDWFFQGNVQAQCFDTTRTDKNLPLLFLFKNPFALLQYLSRKTFHVCNAFLSQPSASFFSLKDTFLRHRFKQDRG